MKIVFSEAATEVEEVVVTALGTTQRKISSLAAVTAVDVKDLQQPTASVANLLGGRVAGVISSLASGEPGKNIAEFWIRGIGTFGANASALVLIDGLEGDINSIDPSDIESFSVLKDASATAVYGVRGANGVVLITTKRGKAGDAKISYDGMVAVSQQTKRLDMMNLREYAQFYNEMTRIGEIGDPDLTYSDPWVDFQWNGVYPTYPSKSLMVSDATGTNSSTDIICADTQKGEVVDKVIYINNPNAPVQIKAESYLRDYDNFKGLADHMPIVVKFSFEKTISE